MDTQPLRFGLVGTGHWARITHAKALAATPGVAFTSVWGRNPARTAELAQEFGVTAFDDIDAFFAQVDAVAFSVPPAVQAPLATRAARLGKHLLLEKPVALRDSDADELVEAVTAAGVASVVFFTARFRPEVRDWLDWVHARSGWMGGAGMWLGSATRPASPFNTPWRRDKGGLWDVGPHVVSMLWAALGPVTAVTADAGLADITHLVLHHASGVTSTATVTCSAPDEAAGLEVLLWGEPGRSVLPPAGVDPETALRTALTELAANARAGEVSHPCDVRFGRDIGRVLSAAHNQLTGADL